MFFISFTCPLKGEVSDKEDEDGSDQSDDRNQDKRKSEEEQKGYKKPKVS